MREPRQRCPKRAMAILGLACACMVHGLMQQPCSAQEQPENPVFVDDSTLAADILAGLPGLIASGNQAEAVRLVQQLLDTQGDRLITTEQDNDLYESVRSRVHRILLANPALLERYRTTETAKAQTRFDLGKVELVARTMFLTTPGFDAGLAVAGADLGAARFESARLMLGDLAYHPDRNDPEFAGRALVLATEVARYLDRLQTRRTVELWAGLAGKPIPAIEPVAWPDSFNARRADPRIPGLAIDTDSLLGMPLRSVELRPKLALEAPERERITRQPRNAIEYPYTFPLVVDDTIYTTDGLWVGAWDRFTLTLKWKIKPRGAALERETLEEVYAARVYRQRQSHNVEEATVLAVSGRLLLVTTGIVADGNRQGDPRLHAIDRMTGRVLWSIYIDELAPELAESTSRGPVLFEGDTLVLTVRKAPQTKRYASAYLVGLDLADGSLRWMRLSGSAGWLAYSGRGQWSDWPVLDEGIVYRVDELGVICAVRAGSGEPVWVRKMPGVESRMPMPRLPWAVSMPVVDGKTLLVLSPDRQDLLRLDKATGAILSRRSAKELGKPSYIFAMHENLVLVGQSRVATVPIARADSARAQLFPVVNDPGIVGRVVIAGEKILEPTATGLVVLDPQAPDEAVQQTLATTGNLVALDNQLLVMNNDTLSSYLVWEQAARVLQARLDADPGDINTAVTFAELAYRAGHPHAVLAPVDRALAAMQVRPTGPDVQPGQDRLYSLLVEMLGAALADQTMKLSAATLDGLADRLGKVVHDPDQRAGHFLLRARVAKTTSRIESAAADCQAVLGDPVLARASWKRDDAQVRAGLEAQTQLDELITAYGPSIYSPFASEAATQLSQLEDESHHAREALGNNASAFELLARRYPRATVAPRAWLDAAALFDKAGQGLARDGALARGLDVAHTNRALGIEPDETVVGELAGRRLVALIATNRLEAATRALARFDTDWPGLGLISGAGPMNRVDLETVLNKSFRTTRRRAVIGKRPSGAVAVLDGWVLLRSLDRIRAHTHKPGALLLSADAIGLWRFDATTNQPTLAWSRPFEQKPVLVRFDTNRVLLLEPDEQGGRLVALSSRDGSMLWQSEPMGQALAKAQGVRAGASPDHFDAPMDGTVDASDLLLVLDEAVIAVMSRSGRAAGIDSLTGATVWATRTTCQAVNDADTGAGVLVYIGTSTPAAKDQAGEPMVGMLDLATGQLLSRFVVRGNKVRWVKVAPELHRAIVGLNTGIVALSIPQAQPDWTMYDDLVQETEGSWIIDNMLFVLTPANEIGLVDAKTGTTVLTQLDTRGRLDRGGPVDILKLDPVPTRTDPGQSSDASNDEGEGGGGEGGGLESDKSENATRHERVVLLGPAGVAIFDAHTGTLLGVDAVEQFDRLVQPALSRDWLVIFEHDAEPGNPGVYRFTLVDTHSAKAIAQHRIMFDEPPRRVVLLDGAIVVTFGDRTAVIPFAADTSDLK